MSGITSADPSGVSALFGLAAVIQVPVYMQMFSLHQSTLDRALSYRSHAFPATLLLLMLECLGQGYASA